VGLVPVNLKSGGGRAGYLSIFKGFCLVIGSLKGQHLVMEKRFTADELEAARKSDRPVNMYGTVRLNPETGLPVDGKPISPVIIFNNHRHGAPEDTYDFLPTTPGAEFKTNFEPTFEIALGDVGAFEREPVVQVLDQARDLVERTLLTFERRFFS
jgi:hypothetical protein